MSTAQSRLQKWLISREPTKLFNKQNIIIENYLDECEHKYLEELLCLKYPKEKTQVLSLLEDTLKHIAPIAMVAHAQFQAITNEVFTINGLAFFSPIVCSLIKRSEFVFPHIISTGKQIEDYALIHTDLLHREVIRQVCSHSHLVGQHLIVEEIIKRYEVNNLLPILPGEPDWILFEGIRLFELFEPIPSQHNLYLTKKGYCNVANTSYGLLIGN